MGVRKRYVLTALGFLFALILQTTVLKHVAIMGYSPNLLLCLIVVSSFLYDEKVGLIYGVLSGLLLDLSTGLYVGPSAIAFVLVYLFVISMRMIFNHERLLPEFLLAGVSTPLFMFTYWLLYKLAGSPVSVMLVLKALPVLLIYNAVIIIVLHLILVRGVIRYKRDSSLTGKYTFHKGLKI